MNCIGIDNNIPLPPVNKGRQHKHPYAKLQIGQSFFVPAKRAVNTSDWQQRTGYRLTVRRVTEDGVTGLRVWRVA